MTDSSLTNLVKNRVKQAFLAHFEDNVPEMDTLSVSLSTQKAFGDYQINSAMKLAKPLKRPPREVAQMLCDTLKAQDDQGFWEKIELAGPGFINLTVSDAPLCEYINAFQKDVHLGLTAQPEHHCVIDFSSPNIAKEMHVGHLRSTIIGESLARIFEFAGQKVTRLNHVGDWGTAFGMLIVYLKQHHPDVLTGQQPATLQDLVQWYKASKQCFDEDSAFKKQAQLAVVALQSGQADARQAWQLICDISEKAYQAIYERLSITLNTRGESFYNPFLADVVETLKKQGLIQTSDGAQCAFLDGFTGRDNQPLPLIVQKSDGGYNYATTDMATLRHRVTVEKADRIVYVTDKGQSLHFQMIFELGKQAGFYDPNEVALDHVGFGLVLGPDGKKFKTRSGDTERLMDLLDEAVKRAHAILADRQLDLSRDDLDHLAQTIGLNAIKYADLSQDREKDYSFSYDRMLQFEGNTATFLLYAYVRCRSIHRKLTNTTWQSHTYTTSDMTQPVERALLVHLLQFPDTLEHVIRDCQPHRLAEYLYQLATLFNQFFRDCRVYQDEHEQSRAWLTDLTARVLGQGLQLLGCDLVEKM